MSSAESAARFLAMYEGRGGQYGGMIRHTWWQAQQFRDVVLEHISSYTPRHRSAILRLIEEDYGSVTPRRVWRHLRRLRCDGTIVRTPDGYVKARR